MTAPVSSYATSVTGTQNITRPGVAITSTNLLLLVTAGGGNTDETLTLASTVVFNGSEALTLISGSQTTDANFCGCNGWFLYNPSITTASVLAGFVGACFDLAVVVTVYEQSASSNIFATTVATGEVSSNPFSLTISSAAGQLVHAGIMTDSETIAQNAVLLAEIEGIAADVSIGAQYSTGAASVVMNWSLAGAVGGAGFATSINTGVFGAPVILTDPQTLAVILGNAAGFSVEASSQSGAALSYAWTENGTSVGGNASSVTIDPTVAADQNARIDVDVWDSNGTTNALDAFLRLTIGAGYYVQEVVSSDRYQLEDASGNYLIESWSAATSVTFGPFFIGPLSGLGTGGRLFKDRLN